MILNLFRFQNAIKTSFLSHVEKWNGTYLLLHAWPKLIPKLDYLIASKTIVWMQNHFSVTIPEKETKALTKFINHFNTRILDRRESNRNFLKSRSCWQIYSTSMICFPDILLHWFLRYLYFHFTLFSIQCCGK